MGNKRFFYVVYKPASIDDWNNYKVYSFGELFRNAGLCRAIIAWIALAKMGFTAITIKPYIISVKVLTKKLFVHEFTHLRQQTDDGLLKFGIKYYWSWFVNFLFKKETRFNLYEAYYNIPYEIEAYSAQENFQV
jgi:hypothetical protein